MTLAREWPARTLTYFRVKYANLVTDGIGRVKWTSGAKQALEKQPCTLCNLVIDNLVGLALFP